MRKTKQRKRAQLAVAVAAAAASFINDTVNDPYLWSDSVIW